MAYCEQCGARLAMDVRFCEECGTPVADENVETLAVGQDETPKSDAGLCFLGRGWKNEWFSFSQGHTGGELGLILTRESALLDDVSSDAAQLHSLVADYIRSAARRNVRYAYLNLDNICSAEDSMGDVASTIAVLSRVAEIACPKYLFILGSERVIDFVRWENQSKDGDADVDSDLCYATLSDDSPWDEQTCAFRNMICVGRLPTYPGESYESFASYFKNVTASETGVPDVVPYGLSALVWESESNHVFKEVSAVPVDTSPTVTVRSVEGQMESRCNLLYFNLHGSNMTEFWYGQSGGEYPEAFQPSALLGLSGPYVLGVEACYGARWAEGLTPSDSILLTALENHCLAMLASSRIAYGTSMPEGSCADIMIGQFVHHVAKGRSAGEAHLEGILKLCANPEQMDDSDVKTLAEFALYGDPSVRLVMPQTKSIILDAFRPVQIPDVRAAVSMELARVDSRIEGLIDDLVRHQLFPGFGEIIAQARVQKVFKMASGMNQKIYHAEHSGWHMVARVYFDDRGCVHKAVMSK